MATAEDLVTDAFRMLGHLDIEEEAPSPAEMREGLRTLSLMVEAWKTELLLSDVSFTGSWGIASYKITDCSDTSHLAPGFNLTATGITARVVSIDSATQITIDTLPTLTGTAGTIAATAFPFQAKFERGVAALLAIDLAPKVLQNTIPDQVRVAATVGWTALTANFMRTADVSFDKGLVYTSVRRSGVVTFNG